VTALPIANPDILELIALARLVQMDAMLEHAIAMVPALVQLASMDSAANARIVRLLL